MKCKHPIKEIFSRWITLNGFSISKGSDKIKKEYACLQCGKTFINKPKNIKEN
jgi:hypothetical protein